MSSIVESFLPKEEEILIKSKKDELFVAIVDNNQKKIYNYLYRLLSNKEDAEDVMQIVFKNFYQKIEGINENSYESYLFRSAYNTSVNVYKKRKKLSKMLESKKIEIHIKNSEHKNKKINKNEQILTALKTLPIKQRTAIELQIYQKKNYKEIAEIMQLTESAIESLLVRARRKLRKILRK